MTYKKILKQISLQEGISVKEVEKEMKFALKQAGIDCSVKEFIYLTANNIKQRMN